MAFEIAIGLNGCVWVSGKNTKETILVRNAILNSEFLTDAIDCQRMVSLLIDDL
ncbi:hypothetical protein DSO57_1036532 [Entomophthora muscae]|nr:hypothetical protein DSO57_1036532 [Entomophthora muscae]